MILIANGTVVDGSGAPARAADVCVSGSRIVDVLAPEEGAAIARRGACDVYDAQGALVTPGFIDAHSHSDAYLILEPDAPSKLSQGITTEINGQCGGSIAPRFGEARLSSDWATLLAERLTWHTLGEYRQVFEVIRPAINSVPFVGHNTLRASVMGYAPRAAGADEVRRMQTLLEEAFDDGAWGLTTGFIYQPGRYAAQEEAIALAQTAARRGGLYATHMRSEGDDILAAIDEVAALARKTGIRCEISHLKTSGRSNWHKIEAVLERVQKGIDEGLFLGSDRYPYCAAGTDLDVVLPDWAQAGAARAECERLADATLRARMVSELDAQARDWGEVCVGGTWHDGTRAFSGRRIAALAQEHGATPGEIVCRILEQDACRTGAFFFGMSEENLLRILSQPWVVPGSDASLRAPWGPLGADFPHPRAYGTMPRYFRLMTGRLGTPALASREETVRRMTSLPAQRFGLAGRGTIRKGAYADIAIWREEDFCETATYAKPHAFSRGVQAVFVNGKLSYRDGRFMGAGGGRLLSRP